PERVLQRAIEPRQVPKLDEGLRERKLAIREAAVEEPEQRIEHEKHDRYGRHGDHDARRVKPLKAPRQAAGLTGRAPGRHRPRCIEGAHQDACRISALCAMKKHCSGSNVTATGSPTFHVRRVNSSASMVLPDSSLI